MGSAGRTGTLFFMLAGQTLVATAFAQSPDDRVLCKREAVTASRLPQPRTCRSVAQWREFERQREIERKTDGETLRREQVDSQPMRPPSPQ
jgi:hypothetical protein